MNREEFIAQISRVMKLARIEGGYTQDRMAEILGISKKTLVQVEKGRLTAGWPVAVTFCTLFRESELVKATVGNDLLEIISVLSFSKYERPHEKTMGGKMWWREVARSGEFRLQQNLFSQHFRILDSEDRRWCSSFDEEYMKQRLQELGEEQ